ncbi:MAG: SdpI family protein [Flavobacteriales bacterium]|nr:SdpI family protein [Flavobacteriales bacterium]MDP4717848.1 SdpI family protein [Flavobacteriales bacterium]MDP4731974.1 SdpI family protein [Flavobacteriales bacterium]MDP4817753.1 SdpI family protein [Flavobacteriales bacterium]
MKFPPKKINSIYGYRTARSMKSQENWDIAQRYSSRLMLKQGIVMLAIGGMLITLPISDEVSALISVSLFIISVIVLFVQTEKKLK